MNKYLKVDPWDIVEEGFDPSNNRSSESLFSLGNGYMGQRANFEESYSGDTLLGNYVGGVYYPDPTKVGWWKNGYPKYYARMVNIQNWIGIDVKIDDETLDLAKCRVVAFKRILHMKEGFLERLFTVEMKNGENVKISAIRFLSIEYKEVGAIKYSITTSNSAKVTVIPYIESKVKNESSNWGEEFIEEEKSEIFDQTGFVTTCVKKTGNRVCTGMYFDLYKNGKSLEFDTKLIKENGFVGSEVSVNCQNDTLTIYKYVCVATSRDHENSLQNICQNRLNDVKALGFDELFLKHKNAWLKKWEQNDIEVAGDDSVQQAIRFNIFQLAQSYNGEDVRLNIGPKGFTGEKYGATTQWDTEAYCLPYYLSNSSSDIAKNLLLYRYNHLSDAIDNAKNLGFSNGAALYPMATVDGKECQNEWEITFEEIHRNGAIAYAIFNYVNYTGDQDYLVSYGLEVLIAISRFWSQRITFSSQKNRYVLLGVTGPNEYENNVDNNWYTNTIACWTLEYTKRSVVAVKSIDAQKYNKLKEQIHFDEEKETKNWKDIVDNMYFPKSEELGVFLQQENYLNKEQITVENLEVEHRPINQNWSWDRILRSCFIKQADVLQGIFFFLDNYDHETIKNNFDFYEARTLHESSLSPCIHAALAARIQNEEKADELFLRATRLDLDDYNNEIAEGCHITSMAGAWMALVYGFAGMLVKNNKLTFNPYILSKWDFYSFNVFFRDVFLKIRVEKNAIKVENTSDKEIVIEINEKEYTLDPFQLFTLSLDEK